MTARIVLPALVMISLATPSTAQIALPVQIFPVTAKVSGAAGTDWVSTLSVSNVGDLPADIFTLFFRENQTNIPLFGPSYEFVLEAGATLTVEDVLGSWFPGEGDTKGFLVLYGETDADEQDPFMLAATQRVFNNANPAATYGQSVPSAVLDLLVAPGVANLPGARWDDAVRSNVGVVNLSLFPLDVIVTTYDGDGNALAVADKRVRSFSLGQWSLTQLGVSVLSTPGRVVVEVDPSSITWDPCIGEEPDIEDLRGIFMAYLSRVDQATGDAEFILGVNDWSEYLALCDGQPAADLAEWIFVHPSVQAE
jgi:hypothetical protein